ncbi:MAG TPA: HAD family hydrolase [Dongiaceae bacterium]|nr:HAD family hydrolase [Dongiaceae bacterium]
MFSKTLNQTDACFFDIDGTLLITRDLVHWNALHQAMLEVYNIDTTIEGLPYHGKTDVAILRAALQRCGVSAEEYYRKLPTAVAVVCREVAANASGIAAEVCPAIPEVLGRIQDRGKLLGVASGNLESVGWHKVSAAGLREYFAVGSFGDQCELRAAIFHNALRVAKQQLGNSAKVCFVGDTPDDIQAARLVNAEIIAVSTGTFPFEILAALQPDECCQSCAELIQHG